MLYLLELFMPYVPEFLKPVQHLDYFLQNFKYAPPYLIRVLYLHKKQSVVFFFCLYHACSGSNIILSMLSIFFSISFIVLFHIASSASSSFRNEFMLPRVFLISFTLPFIISSTSRISLYSSTFTKTGMPFCSFILITLE